MSLCVCEFRSSDEHNIVFELVSRADLTSEKIRHHFFGNFIPKNTVRL